MGIRDAVLLARHRSASRRAFVAFWVLLACAHFTRRSEFYPAIALALVIALGLKWRELSGMAKLKGGPSSAKPGPTASESELWDRDLDGRST